MLDVIQPKNTNDIGLVGNDASPIFNRLVILGVNQLGLDPLYTGGAYNFQGPPEDFQRNLQSVLGATQTSSSVTFEDPDADFIADGVLGTDALHILGGVNQGTHSISTVGTTSIDVGSPLTPDPVSGQSGSAASIVAGPIAGVQKITGLTGMTPASVGRVIQISGAASGGNNGAFRMVALLSSTAVIAQMAGGTVPDGNNGSISWEEMERVNYAVYKTIGTPSLGLKPGDKVTLSQAAGQPVGANDGVTVTIVNPTTLGVLENLVVDAVKYRFRVFRRT
jgi:hypothetical protein